MARLLRDLRHPGAPVRRAFILAGALAGALAMTHHTLARAATVPGKVPPVALATLGPPVPPAGRLAAFTARPVHRATPDPVRTRLPGVASWYGPGFDGRETSNGERFSRRAYTCASRGLAFGTRLRVVNAATGAAVIVRVNDRGPFVHGRTLDLSEAAFRAIAPTGQGVCDVRVEVLR